MSNPEHPKSKNLPRHMRGRKERRPAPALRTEASETPPPSILRPDQVRGRDRLRYFANRMIVGFLSLGSIAYATRYDLHHQELLSSYGKDFLGPLAMWYATHAAAVIVPRLRNWASSKKPLIYYSSYAVLFEGMQYVMSGVKDNLPARYDPLDLVALGAGLGFAIGTDRLIKPGKETLK